jgi:hypothetical protein
MKIRQRSLWALLAAFALVLLGSQSVIAAPVPVISPPTTRSATAQSIVEGPAAGFTRLRAVASRRRVRHTAKAPAITAQPHSVYAASGTYARFVAAASGYPRPRAQWQISANDGATWRNIRGVRGRSFTFMAVFAQNGDEFRAVFKNRRGRAASFPAVLTTTGTPVGGSAPGAPIVTEEPKGDDVEPGASVSYTAAASGSTAPSVQWQVSTDSGQSWSNVPGATAPTYSFVATAGDDLNEYQAVFTNAAGTATTDPAILGVGYELASNWSGYVAANGVYSAVTGSWAVPSVSCASGTSSSSSQWVGIDGVLGTTVEQDGTYASCNGTTPNYGAWYEMVGDDAVGGGAQVSIPRTVKAGDSMTASVSVSGSTWTLTVADDTPSDRDVWTYPETITWAAPAQSSAEWIVERPCIGSSDNTCVFPPLADFGSLTFANATATTGGVTQSIAALGGVPVQMIRSATNTTLLASPGPLNATGTGFSDTWDASE